MKKTIYIIALLFTVMSDAFSDTTESGENGKTDKMTISFHGESLYDVTETKGFSLQEQVDQALKHIEKLAKDISLDTEDFHIVDDSKNKVTVILLDDQEVNKVWQHEADFFMTSRQELATLRMKKIKFAIDKYRKDFSSFKLKDALINSAIATLVFIISLFLISFVAKKEAKYLARIVRVSKSKLKFIAILEADNIVSMNKGLNTLIATIAKFALLLVYLAVVLNFFPQTVSLSKTISNAMTTPIQNSFYAFLDYIPELVTLIIIIYITRLILKTTRHFFKNVENGVVKINGFYPDWAPQTYGLTRIVIVVIAIVAGFPYIPGSGSPAFKGISLFIGVLFSLGSTSAVGNIFAGLVLTYMRAFSPGDYVEVNGTNGIVVDRRTFSLRIRTLKNTIVTIPNISVASNHIINYSRRARKEGVVLFTKITIGYDVPWKQVHELLIQAATSTDKVLKDPIPFVLQSSLDDFYVSYELNVTSRNPEMWPRIHSELHQHIQDLFMTANIEIMSPHYKHNRDGNETTIPTHGLA
ncbi:MAG: mechanosensitive ion channel [Lentisphaeria bacterium]|nr:mechanosensitive ion channel [Lentisphaeria bacterium]